MLEKLKITPVTVKFQCSLPIIVTVSTKVMLLECRLVQFRCTKLIVSINLISILQSQEREVQVHVLSPYLGSLSTLHSPSDVSYICRPACLAKSVAASRMRSMTSCPPGMLPLRCQACASLTGANLCDTASTQALALKPFDL